jgi:maltooligosyltrehalose trehalohydrolase
MIEVDINKRTLGVNFDKGDAIIKVWAPKAKQVDLVLQQGRNLALEQTEHGYWELRTKDIQTGDRYKFLLDKEKELPDPASLSQPEGVHGSSEALDVKQYKWSDDAWANTALEHYIIYELHAGTFTPESNFAGIEQKLDELADLGITAIELMPLGQFAGARNWGYDGVFPYAVQSSYGGAEALQHLVNTCHRKGLAVILDVVYNHIGPEGNCLGEYGYYFTDKYRTPWGEAINFDDAWSDEVRQYFIENALMWLRDFHIDALRMDAVHAIKDLSPGHLLRELEQKVHSLNKTTGKPHYLIVECDLNDTKFIDPVAKKGFGMDAQWIDEFHHALRVAAGNKREGYYSDFDGVHHLAKSYMDAYVYDGIYSPHRLKTFGTEAKDNPGKQFVVFSQNHDQIGNRMLGERTSQLVSLGMCKLLAGAVMVAPFLPMLFMGEEWAASSPFQYFVSHTDPELAEAVRKGRKEEFAAFKADGEAPDPMAQETFDRSKLKWEEILQEPHKTMRAYYKALITLRKQNAVLQQLERNNLEAAYDEQQQTLLLHRWNEAEHIICLQNFSGLQQVIVAPLHSNQWYLLFDSSSTKWGGPGDAIAELKAGENITQLPESILIYSSHV